MPLNFHMLLLFMGIFILSNLIVSKFASKIGTPALLVTLAIGMAFGNGGALDFDYNNPTLTLRLSEIALCIIIFTGGFESNWNVFRPILWKGVSLATVGVLATMVTTGALAHWLLDWPWLYSLLFGAVISGTDAAAVFSIMANANIKLKAGVRETLELESGANDPMAFFLTLGMSGLCVAESGTTDLWKLAGNFFLTMSIGLITGWLAGKAIHLLVDKVPLKRGQFPIILLAWVVILYALNTMLGGSAFLAVYVAGVILGNSPWAQREINVNFFESLSWLMETSLFLVLGLQVYVSDLGGVLWEGLLLALILIFVARPAGVVASLAWQKKTNWPEMAFYSWVGLRGATPLIFALVPVVNKVPNATTIFNLSFVIVITSILLQGTTVPRVAKLLGVSQKPKSS